LAGGPPAAPTRAADSAAAVAAEAGPAGSPGVALAPVPSLGHKSRYISSPISSSKCSRRASLIQSPRDNDSNEKETKSPETRIRVEQRALTRESTARGGRPNLAGGKTYLWAPGAAAPRVWPRPVRAGGHGGAERSVMGLGLWRGGGEVEAKPRADGRRSSSIAGSQPASCRRRESGKITENKRFIIQKF
jgi:hypothetical protein